MTEHTTKTAMTTPTTAEQIEPTVQLAQTLLHHASHPDPISMHCAIPARSVEDAARHLALVEQRLAGARATIARLKALVSTAYEEGWRTGTFDASRTDGDNHAECQSDWLVSRTRHVLTNLNETKP